MKRIAMTLETLLIAWLTAILFGLLVYWREQKRATDYSHTRYRMIVKCC
jgi:hypothetical protein